MKLPMIRARIRAGSNGPPLRLFKPEETLTHWKDDHHKLAQKTEEEDLGQVVVKRIRKQETKKYTTKIFS